MYNAGGQAGPQGGEQPGNAGAGQNTNNGGKDGSVTDVDFEEVK